MSTILQPKDRDMLMNSMKMKEPGVHSQQEHTIIGCTLTQTGTNWINSGKWSFDIQTAGNFEIRAFIPNNSIVTATSARYKIAHNGLSTVSLSTKPQITEVGFLLAHIISMPDLNRESGLRTTMGAFTGKW